MRYYRGKVRKHMLAKVLNIIHLGLFVMQEENRRQNVHKNSELPLCQQPILQHKSDCMSIQEAFPHEH